MLFLLPATNSNATTYIKETTNLYEDYNGRKPIRLINKYSKVDRIKKSEKLSKIKYGNKVYYVKNAALTKKKPYVDKGVPNNSFKSYMSYKAITNRSSAQYKLQKNATTGKYGIRTVNGRYCVALGSYYTTKIGTNVDLIMKDGRVIKCIIGDCKANRDTDSTNRKTNSNGCISEFIVDMKYLNKNAKKMGDMSYCNGLFRQRIKKIRIYNY